MSSSTIEERKETLRQIKDLRKKERKPFIEKCLSECIHTICESKRKILSEPQQGGGIFSMLATSPIPAIIDSFLP